jgi:hypothetical protein
MSALLIRGIPMRFAKPLSLFAAVAAVVLACAASFSTIRAEDFATDVPDLVWIDVEIGRAHV